MRERAAMYLSSNEFKKLRKEGGLWLIVFGITALLLTVGSTGCEAPKTTSAEINPPSVGFIRGQVMFEMGSIIPEDAKLLVQLIDPESTDPSEQVISEVVAKHSDLTSPIPFTLQYDPNGEHAMKELAITASIESEHRAFYETPTWVMTNPTKRTNLMVMLQPVLSERDKTTLMQRGLRGQDWILKKVNGMQVDLRHKVTLSFDHFNRVFISTPCNNLNGRYTTTGGILEVQDILGTMKACPGNLGDLEDEVVESLTQAEESVLQGKTLKLYRNGTETARFEILTLP